MAVCEAGERGGQFAQGVVGAVRRRVLAVQKVVGVAAVVGGEAAGQAVVKRGGSATEAKEAALAAVGRLVGRRRAPLPSWGELIRPDIGCPDTCSEKNFTSTYTSE